MRGLNKDSISKEERCKNLREKNPMTVEEKKLEKTNSKKGKLINENE